MKIFSNFFKGRDAPINRTSGSAYSFFMGGSTSGKRVNERTAMQMNYSFTDIQRMVEKRRLWIIRFIFYSMMNQIRR